MPEIPDNFTENDRVEFVTPSGHEFVRGSQVTRFPAQNRASWEMVPGSVYYNPADAQHYQEIRITQTGVSRWIRVAELERGTSTRIQVWNLVPISRKTQNKSLFRGVYGKKLLCAIIFDQFGNSPFSRQEIQAPAPIQTAHIGKLRQERYVTVLNEEIKSERQYRLTEIGAELGQKFLPHLAGVTA